MGLLANGHSRETHLITALVLRYSLQLWRPKSFCFNNFRLAHCGLENVVVQSWTSFIFFGWITYNVKENLKGLMGNLKRWGKEVFGNLDLMVELLVEMIKDLDIKIEAIQLSKEDMARAKAFVELWVLLKSKDTQIFQRS